MEKIFSLFLLLLIGFNSFSQTKAEKELIEEGTKMYKSEMASWYGTDIFLAKFGEKRENTGGYFSYLSGGKGICVFFSRDESPKIIATISFDSTYNTNTAAVDGQEREPTKQEVDLMTIRQSALKAFQSDTLFKVINDMTPNFIPLNDEKGKRVYVLTGPKKQGVVVFGNDYLLTFDKKNVLKEKKRLHKNVMPIEYGEQEGKIILTTIHTHLPETGDLITATDVCTLMLYEKYAKWGQHIVLSQKKVSLWDCRRNQLLVMTKEAWEKIYSDQTKKQ